MRDAEGGACSIKLKKQCQRRRLAQLGTDGEQVEIVRRPRSGFDVDPACDVARHTAALTSTILR